MHHFDSEPDSGLFVGSFRGPTTAADIARGFSVCMESSKERLAAVWEINELQVAFTVGELRHLFTAFSQQELPDGKMAFVTGPSAFRKSLVNVSGAMRPHKRLGWKTFQTTPAAKTWVLSTA